jgi:hypothetical protein
MNEIEGRRSPCCFEPRGGGAAHEWSGTTNDEIAIEAGEQWPFEFQTRPAC